MFPKHVALFRQIINIITDTLSNIDGIRQGLMRAQFWTLLRHYRQSVNKTSGTQVGKSMVFKTFQK